MINRSEIEAASTQFGAPDAQIIRDRIISHVLASISDWPDGNRITFFGGTFFGGTALCRTWLPDLSTRQEACNRARDARL